MSGWKQDLDRYRDRFLEELRQIGFVFQERESSAAGVPVLRGSVQVAGGKGWEVEFRIRKEFPYLPPKVRPLEDGGGPSWHQEPGGWLCLWTGSEDDLPWTDARALMERVVNWFARDAAGWPGDEPALDLERYFERIPAPPLAIYEDIDDAIDHRIRAKYGRNKTLVLVKSGVSPSRINKRYGWAVDLGELERPLSSWADIVERLGEQGTEIHEELARVGGGFLLAAYRREDHRAAIALRITKEEGQLVARALEAADRSSSVLRLRAGEDQDLVSTKTVGVVGVGAVGSYLADALARAGIGRLVLCDSEILRPGNCVRHLAGLEHIGKKKTRAVRDVIAAASHFHREGVAERGHVRVLAKAVELAEDVDLLVDATGSAPVAILLANAATYANSTVVSTYLQRQGGIARVDRWPLHDDEKHLEAVPPHKETPPPLREAGCGEPVSPMAPQAVMATASFAAHTIIDILCGRTIPPSMIQVLKPQADAPYDVRQILEA